MPAWFFIALGAPLLWASSNYIDKILVDRYFRDKGTGALMIFSAVSGMIVMPFVAIFHRGITDVTLVNAITVVLAGMLAIFGLIPYFYALRRDDASFVVPIFQLIPVFSYLLARVFLGEELTTKQMAAGVLIIIGAIGISLNLTGHRIRIRGTTLWLMLLSSFLMALVNFLFKKVGIQETFWVTTFWTYVGYTLAAIGLFVFVRPYRQQFMTVMKHSPRMIGVNLMNEGINLVAITLFTYASLLGPLALVTVVNGFQPLFIVLIGLILTVYFPRFLKEDISKRNLMQKLLAIAVMLIGVYILNQSI